MTAPRYLNAVLTVIAVLLAVIASQTVPAARAAGTELVPTTAPAVEPSGGQAIFAIGDEGRVRRLVVWDQATSTVYEYDTGGKVRNTWVLKAPGEPLEKR
jgi:hypothetical protein